MKKMFQFGLILLLFGCCHEKKSDPSVLIANDKAFSQMSVEKGLNTAFLFYAADSAVKLQDGKFPITSKNEMAGIYLTRPDSGMILKWTPLRAKISRSNDLGYTFGQWELYLKATDTTLYGNYVSIWEKQSDGSWKYVLDAGSNTPKP
jgi:ketosteroid isomerase-like protein